MAIPNKYHISPFSAPSLQLTLSVSSSAAPYSIPFPLDPHHHSPTLSPQRCAQCRGSSPTAGSAAHIAQGAATPRQQPVPRHDQPTRPHPAHGRFGISTPSPQLARQRARLLRARGDRFCYILVRLACGRGVLAGPPSRRPPLPRRAADRHSTGGGGTSATPRGVPHRPLLSTESTCGARRCTDRSVHANSMPTMDSSHGLT
ncbi:hypothetical protein PVAP13_5NG214562 [Panicum virgatum]|uniref:Uncharacterized protein n=1 Tax=Panicum virgatum TaxID=38727 RepID=A0A8T0RUB5_PANVG|nr:hypothetical protein PVAP13_5NG214562 [Panicum virgatum]